MSNVALTVNGQIPSSLTGSFVRNGPNPIFPPAPYHWFDGDGMVHKVELRSGNAIYSNRFVQTEGFLEEKAAEKSLYGGLMAGPPFKDAANISIIQHHGKTLATWEGGSPYEISAKDLATVGIYDFRKQWPWAFTAHPKLDPVSGNLFIFGYDTNPPFLRYCVLNPKGELIHSTEVNIPHPVMMHDFAITENFAVFLDLPLVFSPQGLKFDPALGARIGVLPKFGSGNEIRWFEIDPCWVYHILNAYEDGDSLTLRACRRNDWPKTPASLHEWRVDLKQSRVVSLSLDTTPTEFPTVNPNFVGKRNRYGFLGREGKVQMDGIIKYDFELGTNEVLSFGEGKSGGESFFVPDTTRSREDAGWLMNYIYDEKKDSSEFIIVDAENLELVASVPLPRRVPYGLHANWIQGS